MPQRPCWKLILCLAPLMTMRMLQAEEQESLSPSAEQLQFFESHIRPLLSQRCFKCHGEEKQSGSLRLDALNTMLAGGDSGPAIVPGKPDESLLVEAIRYESYEMPPDGKLDELEIALLVKWIEMGAVWPDGDRNVAVPTAGTITDEDRAHWAFQPLQAVEAPEVISPGTLPVNMIDHFIRRKLIDNGLELSPPADRLTLVRRVYQDLIGLPPTPEQIDAWLSDDAPDALNRLVDQLLKSPRHGEHWATYWLDLVRYADSDGFRADFFRPQAWQYRDYVIRAFNEDKPYDRFIMEQIAGDELAPGDPDALAATGYLRQGIYEYNQRDAKTQWQDILNDITDTTADAILGLGLGCARCHDHKFDPILQRDYYRLQAFFSGISFRDDTSLATPEDVAAFQRQLTVWEEKTSSIRQQIDALERPRLERLEQEMIAYFPPETQAIVAKPFQERTPHEHQIAYLVHLQVLDKQKSLAAEFKGEEKEKWEQLKADLGKYDGIKPKPLPCGQTVSDVGPRAAEVFIPGRERLGEVAPGFLSVLDPSDAECAPLSTSPGTTGRRAALARWLAQPQNPLTARVIVNRIWQQHFGAGLVATASDFGRLGDPPSHPELLDWLAVNFIENGWSLKWLHRQIVLSQTWQQASVVNPTQHALQVDPDNRLLWRQNIRRLTAEQIRDAALMVSGQLTHSVGGPPEDADRSRRRTVYTKVLRNTRDPLLDVFDLPDRITGTGFRNVTTTPAQSLLMINSERLLQQATAFADRLETEIPGGGDSQIRLAYRLAYAREATEQELALPEVFLRGTSPVAPTDTISLAEMPGSGTRAAVIDPVDKEGILVSELSRPLPEDRFTVEADVLLRSLYDDASVRTIVSQWTGKESDRGWSLGVTSSKSRFRPGNLILQIVGTTPDGEQKYEVIASDFHLDLGTPYRLSATFKSKGVNGGPEVVFRIRPIGIPEMTTRTVRVESRVAADFVSAGELVVGGRTGTSRHRWDGLIDSIRITDGSVSEDESQHAAAENLPEVLASWTFDQPSAPLASAAMTGHPLRHSLSHSKALPFLVDLCHVILNSNEFLYVD